MNTTHTYPFTHLSHTQFQRLRDAQAEAAQVWNLCMQMHRDARLQHDTWPGRNELQKATKGCSALHSQSIQMVVHAFLANIETTQQLRQTHPQMRMRYPYKDNRFYPVHWPAQAVSRERGRVVLPMGKGRKSLVLPLALPENSGACTLVWNNGYELHVCGDTTSRKPTRGQPRHRRFGRNSSCGCDHEYRKSVDSDRTWHSVAQTTTHDADTQYHEEAEQVYEVFAAVEEVATGEKQAMPTCRTTYPQPTPSSDTQGHQLLYRTKGRHALHWQSAWCEEPEQRATSQPTYGFVGIWS